jgi:CRP/FNR family cyclic AMP-dependent transcriptional regulator
MLLPRPDMTDAKPEQLDLEALTALGVVRLFPRNTIVFQEGDKGDQLYVIVSGKVKVFLADSEGKEIIVDVLSPGQYFGEMALDGSPRSASVMTMEASRLSIVEREAFKRFLAADPEAAFSLVVTLIRRARNLTRAVGSLALLDVYGRVARLLLENATEESGHLVVGTRMTQQEIAKRVGASREMVWRILDDLREGKYIAIENNRIVIQQQLPKRW